MEQKTEFNAHNKEEFAPMHTAEHILNQAMIRAFGCGRNVGGHIERKKSKCDYALAAAPTPEQLAAVEREVNRVIAADLPVREEFMTQGEAAREFDLARLPQGASEAVRVIRVGDYDACLCLGRHVERTGQIGRFVLLSSSYENGRLRLRFKLDGCEWAE